jgi:hypothetical protein
MKQSEGIVKALIALGLNLASRYFESPVVWNLRE